MSSTIYIYTFFSFPFKVYTKRLLIQIVFPYYLGFFLSCSYIIVPMWKIKLFIRHQSVSSTSFLLTRIYLESLNNSRFCTDTAIWQLVRIWQWYRNPPAGCWRKEKKIRRKHHWVKDQSFSDDEQAQVTMKNRNEDDHEKQQKLY